MCVCVCLTPAESESEAEKILFSYGFGAHLPTTARRRAQQSVRMAQRVLQLERINAALRRDTEAERAQSKKFQEECAELQTLLSRTGQPQSYMVQSLRTVQEETRNVRNTLTALQTELGSVKEENKQLKEIKKQMTFDIETLLSHRQELSAMKQLLLSAHGKSSLPHLSLGPLHPSSLRLHPTSLDPSVNADIDPDSFTPHPVLFVSLVSWASQFSMSIFFAGHARLL
jgi:progesterone-induced-blocking factor 1